MSFKDYYDFMEKEQFNYSKLKQGDGLIDLYDLETQSEQTSPPYSRKSSSSSVSTEGLSLLSLEQLSKHSTINSTYSNSMLISPPEESKSIFRKIVYEESEEEEEDIQVGYGYWNQMLPNSCHTDNFESMVAHEADDETDDRSSFDELTVMEDSLSNCQYPRQLVGLGITFGGDNSSDDNSIETHPYSLVVTLKVNKEPFCETVAERRKRTHKNVIETNLGIPVRGKKWEKESPSAVVRRIPSERRAKLKAMKSLHEQPIDDDSPSPTTRGRYSKRGPSGNKWDLSKTRPAAEYCKYKYNASKEMYQCLHCHIEFRRLEHLKRHSRSIHSAERPYGCYLCDKFFARSDNLAQHIKVHQKLAVGKQFLRSRRSS